MFNNKTILITGGTGSFGNAFTKTVLKKYNPKKIIIFSRDEMKQWSMALEYSKIHKKIKFIIGDVRDKDSIIKASHNVDFIVHAAATKIVPTAETNPFECIKTNINGAMNVIEASLYNKVKKVVALSTDKASNPINLYGATKLASDKLFVSANALNESGNTKFSIVRYGNVMGSRGSVIPFFYKEYNAKNRIPITNKNMTRFMISLEQAVDLVFKAFVKAKGGEIFVKKIPSMNIIDIAKAISSKAKIDIIGVRPGEKIHEQMIGAEDSPFTFEYKDYYKILPSIYDLSKDKKRIEDGKKVKEGFIYSSDTNNDWMKIPELKKWITKNLNNF